MKTITFLITLLFLASCNDAMRTRLGKCRSSNNRAIQCGTTDALTTENYRIMNIAEVTTPIVVGEKQLVLIDQVQDVDFNQEFICELDISANKKFSYRLEGDKLTLKDGFATLSLSRTNGPTSGGLLGTWAMEEKTKNGLDVTELILQNLEEIRIRKKCYSK